MAKPARAVRGKLPAFAQYLKQSDAAVRTALTASTDLPSFLKTAGTLTVGDAQLLIAQALLLLEQNYVHLPLKRAMHAVDPIQRLKLLEYQMGLRKPGKLEDEPEFHREMTEIFTSVRDLHTNYILPEPYRSSAAYLPFLVEEFYDGDDRKYLVSKILAGFTHPTFVAGVEVTSWNGAPIGRAVTANAQRCSGSNPEARRARGVQGLTMRQLALNLPPDEEWIIVGYIDLTGAAQELRMNWMITGALAKPAPSGDQGGIGLDLELHMIGWTRKMLYAPKVVAEEKKWLGVKTRLRGAGPLDSKVPGEVIAEKIDTPQGPVGRLRIWTFNVKDINKFLDEVQRLLGMLPQDGLIIDVRGNGGGLIAAGEGLLQLLTPRLIEPEPMQLVNTKFNAELCRRAGDQLDSWRQSAEQAIQTGSVFSNAYPLTPAEFCNRRGQVYQGPVVLITDALCYSTTDIFAAGFQDHEIGPILGVHGNTGAGGANVWDQSYLMTIYGSNGDALPYRTLPKGASMRIAFRRSLRVGKRAGTPLEDLGVTPDEVHRMTRNDLLKANQDLIAHAVKLLRKQTARRLDAKVDPAAAGFQVTATTKAIARLDIYVDTRPQGSINAVDGPNTFAVTKPVATAPSRLELQGFDKDGVLVARSRVSF